MSNDNNAGVQISVTQKNVATLVEAYALIQILKDQTQSKSVYARCVAALVGKP